MTTVASLAVALGDAFLAAERWQRGGLVESGGRVLGVRRRWLWPLADAVLAAYPRAPRDRPRELAAFLADLALLTEVVDGARQRGQPIVVRARLVTPTRTLRRPWSTPVLDDLGDLARLLDLTPEQLDWYADRRGMNRRTDDHRLHHYRYRWAAGGRLIEAPKPRLRVLHRRLLAEVLGPLPVHPAAHGFVPGRSAYTFAAAHAGQAVVVRVDLAAFFGSVPARRVYGLLRTAGYPEPVAHALTAICTTRTPAPVLRTAPADLPDRAWRLAVLRGGHLPQGAPTSPALANLCAFRLDRRLTGLAVAFDLAYQRYADDLAFSGELPPRRVADLLAAVTEVTRDEGFRVHSGKTRVRGRADRQLLAGLVVNERPAVPRTEYDLLRAILHNAARTGLAAQNHAGHPAFAEHLIGRVAWLSHAHPTRSAKLARLLTAALAGPVPRSDLPRE
ncbi:MULTISPECIES: reverse transcriptase family protein [Micromonospora]|uniref:RNA-directed DNA polymerase n=1 Tax=Micromonospora zamorensis TaxID=709883 RepID=A0ABZ1PBW9_9ACTN|nr:MULTISPECIES: reverse transcriptase family protein [Micromonospora]MBQ1036836.1 RNA-directed DNA polymerase [Micromonospora sp. C81]WSK46296.1 reverse transcriptase family protein [Micromonospora zamorensis]WTE85031.1 reverse transcriptase family protein [Micromonospora zamorensis]